MHEIVPWIYIMARTTPYWALPLVFVFIDLMIYFRRKRSKVTYVCAGAILTLLGMTAGWVVARGDINADHWMNMVF